MTLKNLGYTQDLEKYRIDNKLDLFKVGRISLEHKDSYVIITATNELDAELIGNLRYNANSRKELPVVGDWVAISIYDDNKALIHAVYPRQSLLERQKVNTVSLTQIIASNIDYGFIVQSVINDFNFNRLERYVTICNTAKVQPIIVLSKIDLISKSTLENLLVELINRVKGIKVFTLSNISGSGLKELQAALETEKTYCLLGSSGVGKSSLLNSLSGKDIMDTTTINNKTNRGKHKTTHRELIVLQNGSIIIDNPGMREIGISKDLNGIEITFDAVYRIAAKCKFKNCTHNKEKGCAVLQAVKNNEINESAFANFKKIEKENAFFELSGLEKKKKDKDIGRMIKSIKKQRKFDKF